MFRARDGKDEEDYSKELQKQLRSADDITDREDICRELIATRMAAGAKRGGAFTAKVQDIVEKQRKAEAPEMAKQ